MEKAPGIVGSGTHIVEGVVDKANGNHLEAADHFGKAAVGIVGGGVVGGAVGGGVKGAAAGAVTGEVGVTAIDYAKQKHQESQQNKDNQKSDDGNTAKMLTPSLDTPSKDKPKSDDDGKSELQKLKDDPFGYLLKDLP